MCENAQYHRFRQIISFRVHADVRIFHILRKLNLFGENFITLAKKKFLRFFKTLIVYCHSIDPRVRNRLRGFFTPLTDTGKLWLVLCKASPR